MTQEEFKKQIEAIPNEKLHEMASEALSKMCKTGGNSFTMTVPPRLTDTDIIFAEVLKRWINN